jgi:hypothetical protein
MPELPWVIGFMSVLEPVFTKPAFILRADAALYELPSPRKSGQRGRPRLKGARLPKPSELAKTVPAGEWMLRQTCGRGNIRERLLYVRQVLWASVSKRTPPRFGSSPCPGKAGGRGYGGRAIPPRKKVHEIGEKNVLSNPPAGV